jgi:ribonucleotide reductase alpha subunit
MLTEAGEKVVKYRALSEELSEEKIWDSYHKVIPFIPESGVTTKDLPPELKEIIMEMRLRFLGLNAEKTE